jgi:hypothetical protein
MSYTGEIRKWETGCVNRFFNAMNNELFIHHLFRLNA